MGLSRDGTVTGQDRGTWGAVSEEEVLGSKLYWVHCTPSGRSAQTETAEAAKSLQLCPTLCNPIDGSPSGSPVPGILQARTLEWVAISFSKAWKWKMKVKLLSHVWLFMTPWSAAHQAPPSMGFSRQEYWSGVPLTFLNPFHGKDQNVFGLGEAV